MGNQISQPYIITEGNNNGNGNVKNSVYLSKIQCVCITCNLPVKVIRVKWVTETHSKQWLNEIDDA